MDSCGFLPLHLRAALAGGDEPDACEDEQDGEDLREAEGAETTRPLFKDYYSGNNLS